MSQKSDLQVLVASLSSALDAVKSAVDALPEEDSQVAELQKKIEDLQAQLAGSQAAEQADAAKLGQAKADADKLASELI